jgi:hypothetical protein
MERGEVDGMCVAYDALTRQKLYREKKLNILFQAALKQDPKITSNATIISDSVTDPDKKRLLEFFLARAAIGRPLVAPPGVPADRVKALQTAFMATMSDAAFMSEASKLGLSIDPISGAELADLIARIYSTPAKSVNELAAILKKLGG